MPANSKTCAPACRHFTPVDVMRSGGFPCQDVSSMGKQRGLAGARTGLFFDAMHIVSTLKPPFSYLKMSPVCCFQTMAATSKQSLKRLPNAGMWDFGACWTAVLRSPHKTPAAYSWSQVSESCPLDFMGDAGPMARLSGQTEPGSAWAGRSTYAACRFLRRDKYRHLGWKYTSLLPTHGIRWLSGARASDIMGFAADWMRPTLARLSCPGNAVCPPVAQWIAKKLITTFQAV